MTTSEARAVDQFAVDKLGFHSLQLMENAGRATTDYLVSLEPQGAVAICCGRGNNAGDGYVIARHLMIRGYKVRVIQCCDAANLVGDALVNYRILKAIGGEVVPLGDQTLDDQLSKALADASWAVDALLGTGARGAPRAPLDRVVQHLNQANLSRLAVDVPTGLDADDGTRSGVCFRADHTVTFVAAKTGLLVETAAPFVGKIHVADIGLPVSVVPFFEP